MASSVLVLSFEGPIQAWGTRSRWDVRDTGLEPTKSGVIGLIGCAKGLHRNDPELKELDRELLFGVRIDRPGLVATDYQTVTGYHRTAAGDFKHDSGTAKSLTKAQQHGENTIVSARDYLYDAAFIVVLAVKEEHRDDNRDLLSSIKGHLQNPKWPIYLGRKACVPSRPIFCTLTNEYEDLERALRLEPWVAPRSPKERKALRKRAPKLLAWIECPDGEYERQDALRLNQLRFYDFRRCRRIEPDIDTMQLSWRIG